MVGESVVQLELQIPRSPGSDQVRRAKRSPLIARFDPIYPRPSIRSKYRLYFPQFQPGIRITFPVPIPPPPPSCAPPSRHMSPYPPLGVRFFDSMTSRCDAFAASDSGKSAWTLTTMPTFLGAEERRVEATSGRGIAGRVVKGYKEGSGAVGCLVWP